MRSPAAAFLIIELKREECSSNRTLSTANFQHCSTLFKFWLAFYGVYC